MKEKQDFLEEGMMYGYCSVRLRKHSCKSPCRVKLLYGVFIIHLDGYLFIYLQKTNIHIKHPSASATQASSSQRNCYKWDEGNA